MPGCKLEAAHTQKNGIENCLHLETAMHQLVTSFLACELLRMNAPSVGMLLGIHSSDSWGN